MAIFLPNLLIFFFVFSTTSATTSKFSYQTAYADHCASFVPQSTPKGDATARYPPHQKGYYTGGGSGILSPDLPTYHVQNSMILYTRNFRETDVQGLLKLDGHIQFHRASTYYFESSSSGSRSSIQFLLHGFLSESSGRLCMVGSGSGYTKGGSYLHDIQVLLKLYNFFNSTVSTSVTSLISGTLESLSEDDSKNSEPVSILILPSRINYNYTLLSNTCGSDDLHPPTSLKIPSFFSPQFTLNHEFDLKYSSHCASSKNCTPVAVSDLPLSVSLKDIDCSNEMRLRVLVEFGESSNFVYRRPFNPNTTLIGEGSWDAKKNQLCFVACQFLDAADSWNNIRVGDCSTRITLRFPAIWTIGNTSSIVGNIWSIKNVTESGYFEKITFESPQDYIGRAQMRGLKYEYTKIDRVKKLCLRKKTAHDKISIYPDPFSYDMRFDASAKNSKGVVGWANSYPLSVGDKLYKPYWYSSVQDADAFATNNINPCNISYKVSIKLLSDAELGNTSISNELKISAEGIYDETEGSLCMVGCLQTTNDSVDCEILVNFQFPPTNSENGSFIKGSIKSTRKKSDPLYFESWDLSSVSGYLIEERRTIWRMDVEISLVLISTTLACVFVALQLFHGKKHPDALPTISIFMLLILNLGSMVPLMLNFEAMFTNSTNRQNLFLGSGGWLEVNEVIVRVTTMVAFLLQIRLLQLTWSARSANGTQENLWISEMKALFVSLLLYVAGGLAALLLPKHNWRKSVNDDSVIAYPRTGHHEHSILGAAMKSYAGLVLDGFLLPQILFNMFFNSKEKALSVSFYVGTTFVRVLPHAYDLYRAHNYAHHQLKESYIYASPVADFYSTAWDVLIPFGGLLFAGIIYLQQKFGGLCIVPQKLRELGSYEKVPTDTEG